VLLLPPPPPCSTNNTNNNKITIRIAHGHALSAPRYAFVLFCYNNTDSIVATSMTRMEHSGKGSASFFGGGGGGDGEIAPLLREQKALLQQAVGYLKTIAAKA
jgi:hypothetical protein